MSCFITTVMLKHQFKYALNICYFYSCGWNTGRLYPSLVDTVTAELRGWASAAPAPASPSASLHLGALVCEMRKLSYKVKAVSSLKMLF